MDAVSGAEAGARKRKSRGRGLRTTTGCLTCRKRHLKCDGVAPECGPCSKSQRLCSYAQASTNAPLREALTSPRPASSDARSLQHREPLQQREPQQGELRQTVQEHHVTQYDYQSQVVDPNLRSWNPNSPDHERTQAASGLLYLNSGGPLIESDQVLSPEIGTIHPDSSVTDSQDATSTALTPPDAAFSRWFNLLTGDGAPTVLSFETATSNEDQNHTSPTTTRAGILSPVQSVTSFITGRDITSVNQVAHSNFESNAVVQSLSQRQPWHGSEPSKLNSHEQTLFENYVKEISTWIDLLDPKRHFSSFVPHLAMHDAGLMNAILALSARHLYLSLDANDQQRDANIGIQYYNETLHYLQKAMRFDTYTVSYELLATALIVSTYEMLDEFGTGWERHLQGVFWIQRSQLIQGESKGFKQAVWWAWLRQDVWAAFRERRKTFSYWKPTRAYKDMYADELALRSIWLFARAVDYCSMDEIKAGESNLPGRIERAETILDMLDEWQRNLTIDFTPLPSTSVLQTAVFEKIWIHPPAFAVSIQLHHSARILLLLHSPSLGGMQGYMKRQRLLDISAETICGIAMSLTDNASSIMSSQCLYVAGLCTQDLRKRGAIVELIDQCQMRTGWPTKSFSEELKVEWKKIDTG